MHNAYHFDTRSITGPRNINGDDLLQQRRRSATSTAKVAFVPSRQDDLETRRRGVRRGRHWASLLAFVLVICLQVALPTQARSLSQSSGVHYEDCQLVASAREVHDECGHQIQPSALAYLPTYRRLLIVGQEYILHATEVLELSPCPVESRRLSAVKS